MQEMRSIYNEILTHLTLNESVLTRLSSAQEFSNASRYTQLILQFLESRAPPPRTRTRDEYMAENILRIADASPGSKVVVWAHNGHIDRAERSYFKSTGSILASIYGNAYYALGFSFNQGSFQARSNEPEAKFALTSFTVGPAAAKTFDWQLAQPRIPIYIVDFRNAGDSPLVSKWLSSTQKTRSIGSVFPVPDGQITPARQFDGMLFIDRTTRARPNPSVSNVEREAPPK
jgi:erythromycin esterase